MPKPLRNRDKFPINKKCILEVTILEASFLKDADFLGKQDPYIAFNYQGKQMQTTVKEDAGKFAKWNERLQLNNIQKSIKNNETLVLEAYDKDPVGSDFLGSIQPMFFTNLEQYEGRAVHNVDLLDKHKKIAGNIKFKTELIWKEYNPPPSHELLDKKSLFKVIVHQASFLKDTGDLIGKQDPFIRFKYEGKNMDTDVKDDAGKFAKWDETF